MCRVLCPVSSGTTAHVWVQVFCFRRCRDIRHSPDVFERSCVHELAFLRRHHSFGQWRRCVLDTRTHSGPKLGGAPARVPLQCGVTFPVCMAEPLYIKAPSAQGDVVFKAWKHVRDNEPWLGWEMHRVATYLNVKVPNGVGRYLRQNRERLEALVVPGAGPLDEAIVPNRDSWKHSRPGQLLIPEHYRNEYQMTTKGVLSWMLGLMAHARSADRRQAARMALRGFLLAFGRLGPSSFISGIGEQRISENHVALCEHRAVGQATCFHVASYLAYDPPRDIEEVDARVHMLAELHRCESACASLHAALAEKVHVAALAVQGVFIEHGVSDAAAMGAQALVCHGKRSAKRLDEDLRSAMMGSMLQERRGSTVGAIARASGVIPEATAKNWIPRHLAEYRASLMLSFAESSAVCICFDASRVGCPKEETLTTAIVDLCSGRAGWLAPQATYVCRDRWCVWAPRHVPFAAPVRHTCTLRGPG